jgi:predicted nucleic-acid-binding protein
MIAVDTNILVRHLTRDDPDQGRKARAILASGTVLIRKTVILETEWVLRHSYKYSSEQVADAMEALTSSKGIDVEDSESVLAAIEASRMGLDFADALHLAGCPTARFATFDKDLAKRARAAFKRPDVITP